MVARLGSIRFRRRQAGGRKKTLDDKTEESKTSVCSSSSFSNSNLDGERDSLLHLPPLTVVAAPHGLVATQQQQLVSPLKSPVVVASRPVTVVRRMASGTLGDHDTVHLDEVDSLMMKDHASATPTKEGEKSGAYLRQSSSCGEESTGETCLETSSMEDVEVTKLDDYNWLSQSTCNMTEANKIEVRFGFDFEPTVVAHTGDSLDS